jgi:hypothetical protein
MPLKHKAEDKKEAEKGKGFLNQNSIHFSFI